MKILLTNDDGIDAPGLDAIARALSEKHDVFVSAPDRTRSAASSSLTIYDPLVTKPGNLEGIPGRAVNGTPVDCVKLAVRQLLPWEPDLVVSGINDGFNTGSNILYSGTVAAALEGALLGFPAVALSQQAGAPRGFDAAAKRAVSLIESLFSGKEPETGVAYNINFPATGKWKVLVTRQETAAYPDDFDKRTDPRGRAYYWISDSPEAGYERVDLRSREVPSDAWACSRGNISVTPLHRDLTSPVHLDLLARQFSGDDSPSAAEKDS